MKICIHINEITLPLVSSNPKEKYIRNTMISMNSTRQKDFVENKEKSLLLEKPTITILLFILFHLGFFLLMGTF
jgi:hypothetical protein